MAESVAQVLMKRNGESMNVPEPKVPAFLADGWVEVSRTYVDVPAAVAVETADDPAPVPADEKPKGKGK
jgi:hypothetical protein